MSGSRILFMILNIFKRKRMRSATSFLMKCFDFFVFLLLRRENKDEDEKEDEYRQNYSFSSFIIFTSEGLGLPPPVKPYGVEIYHKKS